MESLHYLLMADHLKIQSELTERIRDTDLSPGQPKILDYLKDHDGSVQKDIAEHCQITPATIVSVLSGMEKNGLIERRQQDGNRRSLYVYLTSKGKEFIKRLDSEFSAVEEKAVRDFTSKETETLKILLTKIYENFHKEEKH